MTLPAGRGLAIVLVISESVLISYAWLSALAAAEQSAVPSEAQARPGKSTFSGDPATYPAAAVATTRAERRALESWR